MTRGIFAMLAAVLAIAPATAQPVIDDAREDRWAQEVIPGIVVGDAVFLATPARAKVLAILTLPRGMPKGGVVVIHGLGVHPDFGMIGGVRTRLADAGYATLSVQMPVLAAGASREDYRIALPAAGERIGAAVAFLRAKGIAKLAIVAFVAGEPVLLRPGGIPAADLARVLHLPLVATGGNEPRASGTLPAHYAPRTRATLLAPDVLRAEVIQLEDRDEDVAVLARTVARPADFDDLWLQAPASAAAYAHDLYANLRKLDAANADVILIEAVPNDDDWLAVRDRLTRATRGEDDDRD